MGGTSFRSYAVVTVELKIDPPALTPLRLRVTAIDGLCLPSSALSSGTARPTSVALALRDGLQIWRLSAWRTFYQKSTTFLYTKGKLFFVYNTPLCTSVFPLDSPMATALYGNLHVVTG